MNSSSTCDPIPVLTRLGELAPLRYGEERARRTATERCPDCDVAVGGFHHRGCDVEECPGCQGQLLSIWPVPAGIKGRYTQDHVCNPIRVITVESVFDGSLIPLLVARLDETWQILDGASTEGRQPIVAVVGDISDLHQSLRAVLDLPIGWEAWRDDPSAPWQRGRIAL